MKATLTATEYFWMLFNECTPQGQPIHQTDDCLRWPVFLDLIECICLKNNFVVQYETVSDGYCTISVRANVADEQLPLFADVTG